jgi:TPR repeat protein
MKQLLFLIISLSIFSGCATTSKKNSSKTAVFTDAHNSCYAYLYGEGAEKNYKKALAFCTEAAETNAPSSVTLLAEMYYMGYGVKEDYQHAGSLYEKAAKQGHVHAQLMMFFTYVVRLNDVSTDEEIGKGVDYLKQAANSGYQKAIDVLAEMESKSDN